MAAEFLLTFAAEGILTKVCSLASQELTLAWGFKAELKKLGKSLSVIQDFLRGAADQKPQDQGKAVEEWVKKLKDIAHEADDVLDEFNYEVLRRKVELQNHMKRKVLNFLSASNPHLFRHKMAHKIKKINDALVELKNEAAFIKLVAKRRDSSPGGDRPDRDQTDSFLEKDEKVVGREDVVSKIVESLTNSNNQQDLSVMAIAGMPGLGKTTLVKSVYNEPAIDMHFHMKIWVCVSNTFEVDTILSQILDSLRPEKAGIKSQDALIKVLREELKEKRYVLVLDDVWNEDRIKWESLMSSLSKLNSAPGSNIIITTRSTIVASITETLPRLELGKLSSDDCWSIMKQKALEKNDVEDSDRETIGRAIAEKCGGIPLVAKVLGSMMHSKNSTEEWSLIQKSEIWKLPEGNDRIMSVLKLSFHNLKSSRLKQCFAYCSIFRKDVEIERVNLIQLWMAQGLLYPSPHEGMQQMEDMGDKCFKILYQNSLFQDATRDEDGMITKCKMHSLVHDLAEEISNCKSLMLHLNHEVDDTLEIQHVVEIPTSTKLLSLYVKDQLPDPIFPKFRALRVLNLYQADIQELPSSIGKLKHLRYLDVSYTKIEALPPSIGKLYNLQTLRMQGTRCLKMIPKEMKNLINLRHLYFDKKMKIPAGILGRLSNLQTIPYFSISKEIGAGIEELGGLKQLKGQLIIYNLEHVRGEEEVKKAKLEEKINVCKLRFVWKRRNNNEEGLESGPTSNVSEENVLQGLQPHPMLESLEIKNFEGAKFPSWLVIKLLLNNLKEIQLLKCKNCEEVPALGHLPNLKHVKIDGMNNLKRIGADFYGYDNVCRNAGTTGTSKSTMTLFPALKTLHISRCGELIEWMEAPMISTAEGSAVVVFPHLEELCIKYCYHLRNAPSHFPSLKKLEVNGMVKKMPLENISTTVTTLISLEIYDIDELTCLPEGMLKKNKNLTYLDIRYCGQLTCIAPDVYGCCTFVRSLLLRNCGVLRDLPKGIEKLPLLDKLIIHGCRSLELIHGFASLGDLSVDGCVNLSSLLIEDYCTSLHSLDIGHCPNLTSVSVPHGMSSLRKLTIVQCGGLSSLPNGLNYCTSIQELDVRDCSSLASISISNTHLLRRLIVDRCDVLKSISISSSFPGLLEELSIEGCNSLESITTLEGFTCLRDLVILDCGKLKYLPAGAFHCLTQLKTLTIGGFSEELDSFPDFQLPPHSQLESLTLLGWPKLKSLPKQVQHLTCLVTFLIQDFRGMEALPEWLGNLTSLEKLYIWDCEDLKYLPTTPKSMECVAKLKEFSIRRCPLLKERCSKKTDPEWPKISCIPKIDV